MHAFEPEVEISVSKRISSKVNKKYNDENPMDLQGLLGKILAMTPELRVNKG